MFSRKRCPLVVGLLLGLVSAGRILAADWSGPFTLIPLSAPDLVLEAVDSGTTAGTMVSLGHPTGKQNQQWVISPIGQELYAVKPLYSSTLALAAAGGKTDNGTPIVLETDSGKPWQLWSLRQNPNHSFSLVPAHAPDKGLDDFGGGSQPGAKQDLWSYSAGDEHLQWVLRPLPGATVPASAGNLALLDVPRGKTKEFSFADSAIFPGTRRAGAVFIPAQYDGTRPACVYVRQDGYNPPEKLMLERLIAAGEMPVTIGVFISPGEMPAPMPGTLGRRNRCFEYDGVGDNYVRFLTEELLPFVAKTFTLRLSTNGNDRCIAGGSSGGIAAFNAAWERPDAFSRVYANSGSFVAFRGGHEFPTLIRKFEAKPIRAYLTTGSHDMENCAGDWFLLDQEMDKALKFSGYDYFFRAIDGPHVAGWNEFFPDAMRFLWKDWPQPARAGPSAPRVRDVITPDGKWELVAQGFRDARGPASNAKGEVFFVDAPNNVVHRIGLDGKLGVLLPDAGQANSLAIGPKGELYTASERTGKISCYNDGQSRVLAEGLRAQYVLAMPDASLYVTTASENSVEPTDVWLVKDRRKTRVASGLKFANGLASRPDQWLLSVADGRSKWVYSFQVCADGSLTNKERFFWLHVPDWEDDAGAASVCYARENKLLVATRCGIQVCADDGPTQVILPLPDRSRVIGLCFGGPELNTLFAFCGDRIWKRAVKIHGIGPFSPWTRVSGNPL